MFDNTDVFISETCPFGEICTDPPSVVRDATNKIAKITVSTKKAITVSGNTCMKW